MPAHPPPRLSPVFPSRSLEANVKTKKWDALLCAGETATQRLSALYVELCLCAGAAGIRVREGQGAGGSECRRKKGAIEIERDEEKERRTAKGGDGNYPVHGPACTCTLVKEVGEKNTPSYLVHFYPLKQFQHCFKIVLSRVIVLCMRPRSSGLRQCVRTLDSSRT